MPEALYKILMVALAYQPSDRYPKASEFFRSLEDFIASWERLVAEQRKDFEARRDRAAAALDAFSKQVAPFRAFASTLDAQQKLAP
jgi:hypothetical protein